MWACWPGLLGGIITMLLYGYFTIKLNAAAVLTGIALNTLASGGTVFLMYILCGEKGASNSLPSLVFPSVEIPLLKDIPILGEALSGHNILTYVAFILPIFVYILIFRTPLGLRIRTVGENENAAASVGINVNPHQVHHADHWRRPSRPWAVSSCPWVTCPGSPETWWQAAALWPSRHRTWAMPAYCRPSSRSIGFGLANALAVTLQTLSLPAEIFQGAALCDHAHRPGGVLLLHGQKGAAYQHPGTQKAPRLQSQLIDHCAVFAACRWHTTARRAFSAFFSTHTGPMVCDWSKWYDILKIIR